MSEVSSAPIHNYCDRWCERCFLTSKCGIYDKASPTLDQDNETFWKSIGDQLEQSMQLMLEEAKRLGVDLNSLPLADDKAREQLREKNRSHPAAELGLRYSQSVYHWRENLPEFRELMEELKSPTLKNSLEVVTWYEVFIHAKVMRALSGKSSEDNWPEDDYPKDYDGSAKIALVAIERSVKAWSTLLKLMPEHTVEIIGFMAMLEQLQSVLEREFPDAWSFIRPGFDEG